MHPSRHLHAEPTQQLVVVYDDSCELCRRCMRWLMAQPHLVPLLPLPASTPSAHRWVGALPWFRKQLLVCSTSGLVWAGANAFIVSLWALQRFRWLAQRLAGRHNVRWATRCIDWFSSSRGIINTMLASTVCTDECCTHTTPTLKSPYRRRGSMAQ